MNDKTIIIEFNGLPGTGKTTISNILVEKLSSQGKSAITGYNRFFWHRYTLPFLVFPERMLMYFKLRKYTKSIGLYEIRKNRMVPPIFFLRLYENISRYHNADYAVIDQGIIQGLVSLTPDKILPYSVHLENFIKELHLEKYNILRVDCEHIKSESMERVRTRPQKGLIYEGLSDDDFFNAIDAEICNFDLCRSLFSKLYPNMPLISIDTRNLPEYNANLIIETLKNLKWTN